MDCRSTEKEAGEEEQSQFSLILDRLSPRDAWYSFIPESLHLIFTRVFGILGARGFITGIAGQDRGNENVDTMASWCEVSSGS